MYKSILLKDQKNAAIGGREAGSAIAFVLIVTAVMLFVAAMGLNLSLSSRRATINTLEAKENFNCAELALERGRTVAAAVANWNTLLVDGGVLVTSGACPLPGDGGASTLMTYQVRMQDNVDESLDGGIGHLPGIDTDNIAILKAQTLQATVAVTSISAVVSKASTPPPSAVGDYAGQDRGSAMNFGTK